MVWKFLNKIAPCSCNCSMIFSRSATKYSSSVPLASRSAKSLASTISGAVSRGCGMLSMSMLSAFQIVRGQSGSFPERSFFATVVVGASIVATRMARPPLRRPPPRRESTATAAPAERPKATEPAADGRGAPCPDGTTGRCTTPLKPGTVVPVALSAATEVNANAMLATARDTSVAASARGETKCFSTNSLRRGVIVRLCNRDHLARHPLGLTLSDAVHCCDG
mmetsp:Transcript_112168/g.356452  ORF Transcript_112168/g.356452 Transcript_112168/m.356452 type:complete len:223 (-) Transcript_112168:15-683(-)